MRHFLTVLAAALLAASVGSPAEAAKKKDFNIAGSIYVGWMPWAYAAEAGIVKKWADKYDINIKVTQINDYVESINLYTAGKFDAVTDVGTVMPHLGGTSFGYDPLAAKMASRRRLRFVYFDGTAPRPLDLAEV